MIDLNDMFLFSKVVEHNGMSGAAKALGTVHSRISRRIKALETSLNAQLIQRSTRHFAVTELGKKFNEHCLKMISEATAAVEQVELAREKPAGLVRVSCETMAAQFVVGPLLPIFMAKHPDVRIALEATDRNVTIGDNFDISIRIRFIPCDDSSMVARPLGIFYAVIVASPQFLKRHGHPRCLDDIRKLPTLDHSSSQGPHTWHLVGPDKEEIRFHHEPVLIADDFVVIRQAAIGGAGVAQLPLSLCLEDIKSGALEIVLPEFYSPVTELQALFSSRKGLLPAVRSLIDFLSANCAGDLEYSQVVQHLGHGPHGTTRFWGVRQPVGDISRSKTPTVNPQFKNESNNRTSKTNHRSLTKQN